MGDGEGEGRGGRKKEERGISKVGSKKRCEIDGGKNRRANTETKFQRHRVQCLLQRSMHKNGMPHHMLGMWS